MEKHHLPFHLRGKSSLCIRYPNATDPGRASLQPLHPTPAGHQTMQTISLQMLNFTELIIPTSNVLRSFKHHLRCFEMLTCQGRWGQDATEECWSRMSKIKICIPNHQDFTGVVLLKLACNENYLPVFLLLRKYYCRWCCCLQLTRLTQW